MIKKNKLLSIIVIIAQCCFILTFSISLPILIRPFYYWQIKSLDIVQSSGFDYVTIKTAYDEMLNYCLGLTEKFSCGSLKYSADGMSHFTDCRKLFILNFIILLLSTLILLTVYLLKKKKVINLYDFNHHTSGYYSGKIMLSAFLMIILLSVGNFDRTFTIFHRIFFPDKNNWLFDQRYDQIILILPEKFFLNCAILIVAVLISISLYLIIKDKKKN
ncbi:MAG: TIGR01906 family membrane protein [Erysipelotrichia bacterium]|nr:TIGR01906 family membrane protein [Erysipelotrichia bacterium]